VTNAVAIAAGQNHTLAVKSDDTVMAWGYNKNGQLGDATTPSRSTQVVVTDLTGVISISAGTHSLAVKSDGTVCSWGTNTNGQLGNGTIANSNVPAGVMNLTFA